MLSPNVMERNRSKCLKLPEADVWGDRSWGEHCGRYQKLRRATWVSGSRLQAPQRTCSFSGTLTPGLRQSISYKSLLSSMIWLVNKL